MLPIALPVPWELSGRAMSSLDQGYNSYRTPDRKDGDVTKDVKILMLSEG
jgi:hypothetical protein